ncbi:NEDD8-conjugating enzyme UBC12 [Schistosoma japonicum]|nr:NEDD8-conjugating enzyme UBC12 [Schistosoma japonicum]
MYKIVWRQLSELICVIEGETNGQAKIISWDNNDDDANQSDEIHFRVNILPNEGLYAHAEYEFEITIRLDRHGETPVVRCLSHIYHPNIEDYDIGGAVCLNLFQNWNIEMGLKAIINGLLFLFYEPNEQDPINERFTIPHGSSFQQAVIESLQGGCYSHYSGPGNKTWCIWHEKQGTIEQENLIKISKETVESQQQSKQNCHIYLRSNNNTDYDDDNDRDFTEQHHNNEPDELQSCPNSANENNTQLVSSNKQKQLLKCHHLKQSSMLSSLSSLLISSNSSSASTLHDVEQLVHLDLGINKKIHKKKLKTANFNILNYLSTINLQEITIIWTNIEKPIDITYYFMETCNYAWNIHCEHVYYSHLNIGIPDIFTTHLYQKSICQPMIYINEQMINKQDSSNEEFVHYNDNCNSSTVSMMNQQIINMETRYLQKIYSIQLMLFTTRWPIYLIPGRMLTENFLKPNWALPLRRASTKQLFEDINHYILNVEWNHSSQIFIIDPLALSPFSPIALRIIYDQNEPKAEKWIYVTEWLSPWCSSTISTVGQNQNRFPGVSIFCWLALLTNWINYLSRYELYHTCLGYSRPESSIFSKAWRITEPFGICCIFSHSLTCGQICLFDGWILWLSSLVMQQITKFSVKVLHYINTKYIKCLPVCRLSSTYDPLEGSCTAIYVFTDVDQI